MQSFNFLVILFVTLFSAKQPTWSDIRTLAANELEKSIRGTISNPSYSLSQVGFFRYKVHKSTKTFRELSNVRFRIDLCLRRDFQRYTTNAWIEKHVRISVSFSSSLVEEPFFLYNSDPHHIVSSFNGKLEGLAMQGKARMKFLDIEKTIKIKLVIISDKLSQRDIQREHAMGDMCQDDCDNNICASTQF